MLPIRCCRDAAADEIKLLECANNATGEDGTHVVKLVAHFEHEGPHGTRKSDASILPPLLCLMSNFLLVLR